MKIKMCLLFNEGVKFTLPHFAETRIYEQLQNKGNSVYTQQNMKDEIQELVICLFDEPIKVLKIVCPGLTDFEICLLILIKSDLRISALSPYLHIYDSAVLYQRKYRMKKKICSINYGEKIYRLLVEEK